jgi:hypothetical protein
MDFSLMTRVPLCSSTSLLIPQNGPLVLIHPTASTASENLFNSSHRTRSFRPSPLLRYQPPWTKQTARQDWLKAFLLQWFAELWKIQIHRGKCEKLLIQPPRNLAASAAQTSCKGLICKYVFIVSDNEQGAGAYQLSHLRKPIFPIRVSTTRFFPTNRDHVPYCPTWLGITLSLLYYLFKTMTITSDC